MISLEENPPRAPVTSLVDAVEFADEASTIPSQRLSRAIEYPNRSGPTNSPNSSARSWDMFPNLATGREHQEVLPGIPDSSPRAVSSLGLQY